MRYRLSNHTRDEMAKRHIGASEIDGVLQAPEQIVPGQAGRNIYQSRIRGGHLLLRVVVNDNLDPAVVITIYPTSRIAKYWRP